MTGILRQATPAEEIVWQGMSRAELDVAYDNTSAVAESGAFLADWTRRSLMLRASQPELIDLAYGPRERNRIDVFRSGVENAPLFVFIHGGYWQRNSRQVFSCMAEGLLPHGIDVACLGYTLAPEARLGEIVDEIGEALRWLRRMGPAFGIAQNRLIVSGWSAGGHLAANAMAMTEVDAGLAISGVFDLEPIRLGVLNDKLKLQPGEVARLSPLSTLPEAAGPLVVAYGTAELPELQRQSSVYGKAWRSNGLAGTLLPVEGANHFSILEQLRNQDGVLAVAARTLSGRQVPAP